MIFISLLEIQYCISFNFKDIFLGLKGSTDCSQWVPERVLGALDLIACIRVILPPVNSELTSYITRNKDHTDDCL